MGSTALALVAFFALALALPGLAAIDDCIDYTGYPHWIGQLETDLPAW